MEDIANRVTQGDPGQDAAVNWVPMWTVMVGESPVGVTLDDKCVVFLAEAIPGQWVPATHVPAPAIRFIANLLARAS